VKDSMAKSGQKSAQVTSKIKSGAYKPGFDAALRLDGFELDGLDLSEFAGSGVTASGRSATSSQAASKHSQSASNIPQGTLTVESVALYIKVCLEDDLNLQKIWVLGEISSVNRSGKGTYFTLQDPASNQAIACVVWNSYDQRLEVKPQQGEQVIVLASVKTYAQQSRYQLSVVQIRSAGEGLQALRYQQLRDRLYEEGLFDPDIKLPLPKHPQTIAVVTSPNAAAWGDIQTTLRNRNPGLTVLLSPATVQGETAPNSIAKAIDRVMADGRAEVIILARGGGATEDLACFNDERVVRAIATCTIPIISGIGHDRDESLADLAADYAAHTPTAAAETVVPDLQALMDQHLHRVMSVQDSVNYAISHHQDKLQQFQRRLRLVRPDRQLDQAQQRLHWLKQQIVQSMRSQLTQHQSTQTRMETKLTALDPHAVLARGYAVVRSELADLQTVMQSITDLTIGQTVELQLGEGRATAKIVTIEGRAIDDKPIAN
jgi:exodeoxyribonuclease VII large subunit